MSDPKVDLRYSRSIVMAAALISMLLISINYFTIKILSSIRSYAHGESQYSKGQKDAVRNLLLLIQTKDLSYYEKFTTEINVPIGDSLARVSLTAGEDTEIARAAFLQGRNHPDDVDKLIWLFVNFGNFEFMKEPIHIWKTADRAIGKTKVLGETVYEKIVAGEMTTDDEKYFIEKAVAYTNESTVQERLFLDALGRISRTIDRILFASNFILTGLILGGITIYNWSVVKKISKQKQHLNDLNKQLDDFLYSATHDLRAPISSMKGLVDIAKLSDNPSETQECLRLMEAALEQQEAFIRQIMDVSKNKNTAALSETIDFGNLVDKTIAHHQHMPEAKNIQFEKDMKVSTLTTDPLRIEIVLNNLMSNAIKYSDPDKPSRLIKVASYEVDHTFVFEIEDNGIGIESNHLKHVFDIFYVANLKKNGSGVGLYLTRETVRKLGGDISVESKEHEGTRFTVRLPR